MLDVRLQKLWARKQDEQLIKGLDLDIKDFFVEEKRQEYK